MSISRSITRITGNLLSDESFPKSCRLRSKRIISLLFETGSSVHTPLLRVVWIFTPLPEEVPLQVFFSVPKKGFRHAVTRNTVRRRLREAFRKNKSMVSEWFIKNNKQVAFAVIVKGGEVPDYETAERNIRDFFSRFLALQPSQGNNKS